MKKIFLAGSLVLLTLMSKGQTKIDSNTTFSTSKPKMDTVVVLTIQEAEMLLNYIQLQASGKVDVKLSIWTDIIDMIRKKVTVLPKNK